VDRDDPRRLREEQLLCYRAEGYVRLGPIVSEAEREALLAEEARFRPRLGYGTRENRTLLVSMQLCHRSAPVREMCTAGRHVPLVVQLLGPNVCLKHTQFLTKLPDVEGTRSDIPWHQDNGWAARADDGRDSVARADRRRRRNGSQSYGSHRPGSSTTGGWRERCSASAVSGTVAVPLRAGEAVAFSGLVHGSGPNRTDRPRAASTPLLRAASAC
jgi:ectoine hydroxylase-related dioxygenase (phytanoyl-CoA dioxygenase family)